MEELLREAACLGNLQAVQKLLLSGTKINSQNSMNGWTALHWACKRGHAFVVHFLLQSGADVNVQTSKGELPIDVAASAEIIKMLGGGSIEQPRPAKEQLPIIPNYLENPAFPYYDVDSRIEREMARQFNAETKLKPSSEDCNSITHSTRNGKEEKSGAVSYHQHAATLSDRVGSLNISDDTMQLVTSSTKQRCMEQNLGTETGLVWNQDREHVGMETSLLVKVRVAGSGESDFVEVEVPSLSYQALLKACCEELEVQPSEVAKIRKLPNIWVRKDRDIQRMKIGEELELVMKTEAA